MGHRELKRVPLDFHWEQGRIWKGYIDPFPEPRTCVVCDGSGHNPETKRIADDFHDHDGFHVRWYYLYGVAPDGSASSRPPWLIIGECRRWSDALTQDEVDVLARSGRLHHFTHDWVKGQGWIPRKWQTKGFWCPRCHASVPQLSHEHPTSFCAGCQTDMALLAGDDPRLHVPRAEEVNAREAAGGIDSHDCVNRWILVETRARRLGVYGTCPRCHGRGVGTLPRKLKKAKKKWKPFEPPVGTGYQLWETTSEGSPNSPVFATAEELADWCADYATIFGDEKTSRANWLAMFTGMQDLDAGSLFVVQGGYCGAMANMPMC